MLIERIKITAEPKSRSQKENLVKLTLVAFKKQIYLT